MSKLDTIIRGGRVATASDTVACDVGIRGGKIVAETPAAIAALHIDGRPPAVDWASPMRS